MVLGFRSGLNEMFVRLESYETLMAKDQPTIRNSLEDK
jgi:hypothetical protein